MITKKAIPSGDFGRDSKKTRYNGVFFSFLAYSMIFHMELLRNRTKNRHSVQSATVYSGAQMGKEYQRRLHFIMLLIAKRKIYGFAEFISRSGS